MKKFQLAILLLLCYFQAFAREDRFKICITSGFERQCDQLDKESPEIECVRVQDSVECAKILRGGTAGIGIFSAESMVLLAALNFTDLNVLKELRHRERTNHTVDFASVVIVKSSYEGGVKGLKGLKYCHPGFYYGRTERWSERFLKHFERENLIPDCESPLGKSGSPAEIEIATVANHFGSSCRPGAWSNNEQEDRKLKAKYPQLCELCSSQTSPCEYTERNRHIGALNCLISKGEVAYVSLQDAQEFFTNLENVHLRDKYTYLCDDGKKKSISDESEQPCTWMTQPWSAIVSSAHQNIKLKDIIERCGRQDYGWQTAVREILTANSLTVWDSDVQRLRDAFTPHHGVPFEIPLCSTAITWCTKSLEEKEKCEVIRTAGLTTGVYPSVVCQEPVVMGTWGCLREVREGRADFTVIDTNYGYIARREFNLTAALYGETDEHALAGVVVRANSTHTDMNSTAGVTACVNEYNGIASVAFINNGKKIGLFDKKNCNHSEILSNFFGSSCIPGASDSAHNGHQTINNLCTLCPQSHYSSGSTVEVATRELIPPDDVSLAHDDNLQSELDVLNSRQNCHADQSNRYYGDKGALLCLMNKGDVAILGLKNLNEHAKDLTIAPQYYQVICRNGSLATHTGFDVDADCALATYVDSEVVIRPNNTKREGIINALISFDKYFRVDPDFKMYGKFDGYENVLFNKGTAGLTSSDDENLGPDVASYNKLLKEVDECGNSGSKLYASIAIGIMLISIILNHLRQ